MDEKKLIQRIDQLQKKLDTILEYIEQQHMETNQVLELQKLLVVNSLLSELENSAEKVPTQMGELVVEAVKEQRSNPPGEEEVVFSKTKTNESSWFDFHRPQISIGYYKVNYLRSEGDYVETGNKIAHMECYCSDGYGMRRYPEGDERIKAKVSGIFCPLLSRGAKVEGKGDVIAKIITSSIREEQSTEKRGLLHKEPTPDLCLYRVRYKEESGRFVREGQVVAILEAFYNAQRIVSGKYDIEIKAPLSGHIFWKKKSYEFVDMKKDMIVNFQKQSNRGIEQCQVFVRDGRIVEKRS